MFASQKDIRNVQLIKMQVNILKIEAEYPNKIGSNLITASL
jgi:hypothetical protein